MQLLLHAEGGIADDLVENVIRICGVAAIFVSLKLGLEFHRRAKEERVNRSLYEARAGYLEILSVLIIAEFSRSQRIDALGSQFQFQSAGNVQSTPTQSNTATTYSTLTPPTVGRIENALTLARDSHCTTFLSDPLVQEFLTEVWLGHIVTLPSSPRVAIPFSDPPPPRSLARMYQMLKIPRYQYVSSLLTQFFFMALYSVVVIFGKRTTTPESMEWIMYLVILSFIMEEVKNVMRKGRRVDIFSIWNWIDWTTYIIFCIAFGFRLYTMNITDVDEIAKFNDHAYDLMSLCAALIWCRILEWLDTFKSFGWLLVTVKNMLNDSILFFVLYLVLLVGFTMAFYGLKQNAPISKILYLLLRGLLEDPEFDEAYALHSVWGPVLMFIYLFISYLILLNLLIAAFSDSYARVVPNSDAEYLFLFTEDVLEYTQRSEETPFLPPTNLVEIVLVPFSLVLSNERYESLAKALVIVLFSPSLALIAILERVNPRKSALFTEERPTIRARVREEISGFEDEISASTTLNPIVVVSATTGGVDSGRRGVNDEDLGISASQNRVLETLLLKVLDRLDGLERRIEDMAVK